MPQVGPLSEHVFDRLVEDLAHRYSDAFSRDEVAEAVAQGLAELSATNRHPEFLPLLVEHYARDLLVSRAHARGTAVKAVPEVLFVCRHNEGRSQMAAALAEHLSGGHVHVRSAGLEPSGHLNPHVVQVLAEQGVGMERAYASRIQADVLDAADVVVLLGVDSFDHTGRRVVSWDVEDPHDQPVEGVRRVRDDLVCRVRSLLEELDVPVVNDLEVVEEPQKSHLRHALRWLPQRVRG